MALQRLWGFLKENQHDILDFWILEDKLKWIKIINQRKGEIYLLNVFSYHIKMEENTEPFRSTKRYILYDTEVEENKKIVFKGIHEKLTESDKYVVVFGNSVGESENSWYVAQNLANLNIFSLYLVIDLDWFYENIFVISNQIDQYQNSILLQAKRSMEESIKSIQTFVKAENNMLKGIFTTLEKFDKASSSLKKSQVLLARVYKSLTANRVQLFNIEDCIHPDDMSFRQVANRQYQRKKLQERQEELERIKEATVKNLDYFFHLKWNYLLQVWKVCIHLTNHFQSIYEHLEDLRHIS